MKKQFDESQTWMISMIIIPVLVLTNIGEELTSDAGVQILYSGIFGALGGVIGFATHYLTKEKSRVYKVIGTLVVYGLSITAFALTASSPTDEEIMEEEWLTQTIGKVEFETPKKLELQNFELPDSVKWFYNKLNLYSDGEKERATMFLKANMTTDTISIENAYSSILEGMLNKMNINFETFDMDIFDSYDDEIYASFSFELKDEIVNGYGYLRIQGPSVESIWLMPIERGFSEEYIEYFDLGIYPVE